MATIKEKTIQLIDELKAVCQQKGLGNDGNEYKIITQVFLYKFLVDKFGYELKKLPQAKAIKAAGEKWEDVFAALPDKERKSLVCFLPPDVPILQPNWLISSLWNQQTKGEIDIIFDETMVAIANANLDIFHTIAADAQGNRQKLPIFEKLTQYVTNESDRASFARALLDKLNKFSFEETFSEHYDFFSDIFEYLIKDYNTAGGGKYAEYYTPKSIAKVMARLLVGDDPNLASQECYDPSAGTGTLLMALSHQIGENKCTIYAQDISQRSNKMLRLNLLLNGLVPSLDYAIQGDTLLAPYHKSDDGKQLRQFDFVVSNPPFKMDFSDTRDDIESRWGSSRFWAGVPTVPPKQKSDMAVYTCFIQHVVNSIKDGGKGAIVVPTGFITAKDSVERKILKHIVDNRLVWGVISMPGNVFANTNTNVSVLFFDKSASKTENDRVILIDASKLGTEGKDANDMKKTFLSTDDIEQIVSTFREKKVVEDFSVTPTFKEIEEKGYTLSAGQYFDIKIDYVDITEDEFNAQMKFDINELEALFAESHTIENEITKQLCLLNFKQ